MIRRRAVVEGARGGQELQRDFAIETRIPGAIDRAETRRDRCARESADGPTAGAPRSAARSRTGGRPGPCPRMRRLAAMHGREAFDHAQLTDDRPLVVAGARFGRGPIDRRAVEHSPGEVGERLQSLARPISSARRISARSAALLRRLGAGLAEHVREFLVGVAHLDPRDDGFPLLRPQRRQRLLVALDRLDVRSPVRAATRRCPPRRRRARLPREPDPSGATRPGSG